MKNALIVLLCLVYGILNAQQGDKNFIDLPYIEVTGKAEMEITPDQVFIQIIIDENDSKNKIPVAELENKMIEKLRDLEIDVETKLVISDLTSNFKTNFIAKSDIILTRQYILEINNLELLTPVFQELEKLGISNVEIIKTDHSEIEKFRQQVKIDAIKAAQIKAQALTKAIGQVIGKAIYIKETPLYDMLSNVSSQPMMYRSTVKTESAKLNFEKIKLEYSILVRFELK